MMIDKVAALLDVLDVSELDKMPPARREKFAQLCHRWARLAEIPQEQPKSGVLSDLRRGQRGE